MSGAVDRVYRAYNAAENAHDLDGTRRLVSSDLLVSINGASRIASGDEDDRANARLFAMYPDYRREIIDIISTEDVGAIRWRMMGTSIGEVARSLDVYGCSIVRVKDGCIVEAHLYVDEHALAAALPEASQ